MPETIALPPSTPAEPEVLRLHSGQPVSTPDLWRRRRIPELRNLFESYVYGRMPQVPTLRFEPEADDFLTPDGQALVRQIAIRFRPEPDPALHLLLFLPAAISTPVPLLLGLNFFGNHATSREPHILLSRQWMPKRGEGIIEHSATERSRGVHAHRWPIHLALSRGYGVATFYHGDADPDHPNPSDGLQPLFYRPGQTRPEPEEWGSLAVWAWSLSRALDYLITDRAVDGSRIAVFGHSRNGKSALLAAAFDERFAAAISNNSGCGGAALFRIKQGEHIADINRNFPHWFCDRFKEYNGREAELPVDQHLLLSLIAPRPLLVCSAAEDTWADPLAEFAAARAADPVYRLLGTPGLADAATLTHLPLNQLLGQTLSYHLRPGGHGISAPDWTVFLDFLDRQMK